MIDATILDTIYWRDSAPSVEQGWLCPVCKTVYSPVTPTCLDLNCLKERGK